MDSASAAATDDADHGRDVVVAPLSNSTLLLGGPDSPTPDQRIYDHKALEAIEVAIRRPELPHAMLAA
jgi:hypothetical protein